MLIPVGPRPAKRPTSSATISGATYEMPVFPSAGSIIAGTVKRHSRAIWLP